MRIFTYAIISMFFFCSLLARDFLEEIFSNIYKIGTWDESGFSLSGSQIKIARPYVNFLQNFMNEHEIKTVVDVGCGDWAFSRYIDWSGIDYLGIDVVKEVIVRNQTLFARPSIAFVHGNALTMDLPEADLLICKDVFQHLSNSDIMQLLKQFYKFKHCLITDFVDSNTLSSDNRDIVSGDYHPIDLTKEPFYVEGEKIFIFKSVFPKQTLHIQKKDDHMK